MWGCETASIPPIYQSQSSITSRGMSNYRIIRVDLRKVSVLPLGLVQSRLGWRREAAVHFFSLKGIKDSKETLCFLHLQCLHHNNV